MNKYEIKREKIFKAYLQQLSILSKNPKFKSSVPIIKDKYICPLCLNYFEKSDLDQSIENPLTLEDAPPKSLGGHANTLTCKSCNNNMGRIIDSHLSLKIKEFEAYKFLPNSEYEVRIKDGDSRYQGRIRIDENRKITVLHEDKNNNPSKLKKFIDSVEKDKIVDLEFRLKDVDHNHLSHAILKTIYMMVFEKFGYPVILHEQTYSRIRKQLQNPEKDIYGFQFWKESEYPDSVKGVNFILEKDLESFLVIFDLKSERTSTTVSGFIPRPPITMPKLERMMNFRKLQGRSNYIDASRPDPALNYILDENGITEIVNIMNHKK